MPITLHWKKKKIPLKNFLLANDQVANTVLVIRLYSSSNLFSRTLSLKILQLLLVLGMEVGTQWWNKKSSVQSAVTTSADKRLPKPSKRRESREAKGRQWLLKHQFPDFILRDPSTSGTIAPWIEYSQWIQSFHSFFLQFHHFRWFV